MSAREKHNCQYHEYERSRANKEIYRCIHPDCTHYANRNLLEKKRALCHACKNPFILTWQQLRNKYPVCEFCTKSPKSQELRDARDAAIALVKGMEVSEDQTADAILKLLE
jgi:hypothetical protein